MTVAIKDSAIYDQRESSAATIAAAPPFAKSQRLTWADVYTAGDVARICRCAPRTVGKWIDKGTLKGYRLPDSRDRRVLRRDLAAFMVTHDMADLASAAGIMPGVLLIGVAAEVSEAVRERVGSIARIECAPNLFEAGVLAAAIRPSLIVVDVTALGRLDAQFLASSIKMRAEVRRAELIALVSKEVVAPPGYKLQVRADAGGETVARYVANVVAAWGVVEGRTDV